MLIDLISKKLPIQEDKTFNASYTITFLEKIEETYSTKAKIHLFFDNARYYNDKIVNSYLQTSKIELHFLPPYSPNLNPIERLWQWMKECVIYNAYYPEFDEFKSAIFGFFSLLSSLNPDSELNKCFKGRVRDKFRPIGAPATNL